MLGTRVRETGGRDGLLAHQRLGNMLTAGLIRLLYGLKISDTSALPSDSSIGVGRIWPCKR